MAEKRTQWWVRFIVAVGMTLIGGWNLMLAVGVIHHEWIPSCPTIGYWWAVLLASLIRAALYNPNAGRPQ